VKLEVLNGSIDYVASLGTKGSEQSLLVEGWEEIDINQGKFRKKV
jgi:hypothetical protein